MKLATAALAALPEGAEAVRCALQPPRHSWATVASAADRPPRQLSYHCGPRPQARDNVQNSPHVVQQQHLRALLRRVPSSLSSRSTQHILAQRPAHHRELRVLRLVGCPLSDSRGDIHLGGLHGRARRERQDGARRRPPQERAVSRGRNRRGARLRTAQRSMAGAAGGCGDARRCRLGPVDRSRTAGAASQALAAALARYQSGHPGVLQILQLLRRLVQLTVRAVRHQARRADALDHPAGGPVVLYVSGDQSHGRLVPAARTSCRSSRASARSI